MFSSTENNTQLEYEINAFLTYSSNGDLTPDLNDTPLAWEGYFLPQHSEIPLQDDKTPERARRDSMGSLFNRKMRLTTPVSEKKSPATTIIKVSYSGEPLERVSCITPEIGFQPKLWELSKTYAAEDAKAKERSFSPDNATLRAALASCKIERPYLECQGVIRCRIGQTPGNPIPVDAHLLYQSSDLLYSKVDLATQCLTISNITEDTFRYYVNWLESKQASSMAIQAPQFDPHSSTHHPLYNEEDDTFSCPNPDCFYKLTSEPASLLGLIWDSNLSNSSISNNTIICQCGTTCTIPLRLAKRTLRANQIRLSTAGGSTVITPEALLFEIYLFACEYEIWELGNHVLTTWIEQDTSRDCLPDWHIVKRGFESSLLEVSAPLLRYFVDVMAVYWDCDAVNEQDTIWASRMPQKYEKQLLLAVSRSGLAPYGLDICKYHIHAGAVEVENCRAMRAVPAKKVAVQEVKSVVEEAIGVEEKEDVVCGRQGVTWKKLLAGGSMRLKKGIFGSLRGLKK
ncbi:hypothetical protein EJ08DRAFT_702699 [Tothia fuscella]|uniref:Uncharacterized protein n=1 Tax=Tothia fuscella TaxID=1048955 RepID=A0A9P4NFR9_9PEZI|nr:hypothetical protein EJ08DRAFT_702699 [Tothia fuscella]